MPQSEIEFFTSLVIEKVILAKITGGNLLTQRVGWGIHSIPDEIKGAVISADYLFYLTNHDQTHTSLWGCRFEQWPRATIGPRSFTDPFAFRVTLA